MDSIIFNEHVNIDCSEAADGYWSDFLEKNPSIKKKFVDGVASPVFIDLLMADKRFTPTHRDDPSKDGTEYSIKRDAIRESVDREDFSGLPVYLFDVKKGDHGFGKRRAVGTTHAAVMREDDRGPYAQVLASIWETDIPDEFKDIRKNQERIGASAEFHVKRINPGDDGTMMVDDFLPTGALLLEKDLAAFKESALYCSDSSKIGEVEGEQTKRTEEDNCDDKPKTKPKGGKSAMEFCDICKPLVTQKIEDELKSYEEKVNQYASLREQHDDLKVAAADAKRERDEIQTQLDELKAEREKGMENLVALSALNTASEKFKKMAEHYPEDKLEDVKKILLNVELGQATPEEVMQLADWKQPKSGGGGGDDQLHVAGGGPDGSGKKLKFSQDQIDRMAGLPDLWGYPQKKGGS